MGNTLVMIKSINFEQEAHILHTHLIFIVVNGIPTTTVNLFRCVVGFPLFMIKKPVKNGRCFKKQVCMAHTALFTEYIENAL